MLIGFVSDERYIALPDVQVEFVSTARDRDVEVPSVEVRSRASGAVYADVEPGDYHVTLAKDGYGSKRVRLRPFGDESFSLGLLASPERV